MGSVAPWHPPPQKKTKKTKQKTKQYICVWFNGAVDQYRCLDSYLLVISSLQKATTAVLGGGFLKSQTLWLQRVVLKLKQLTVLLLLDYSWRYITFTQDSSPPSGVKM